MSRLSVRWFALLSVAQALAGCGGGRPARGAPGATDQTLTELFDLAAVYQRLGRIAAGGALPFVGNLAMLPGRNDSTMVRIGLSLENHSLSFQRDAGAFTARYSVDVNFTRPNETAVHHARTELVRVGTFQETQAAGETILNQQNFLLAPGKYTLAIVVRDPSSNGASRIEQEVTVPAFAPGDVSAPVMVYEVTARTNVADSIHMVLNPRGTVAHGGGDTLYLYVEAYKLPAATKVPVEVKDDRDSVVFHTDLDFVGGRNVEGRIVRIASETPPLGELAISVGTGPQAKKTKALVSFARGWVVTNYDNLLSLLRYFPYENDRLNGLRNAKPADRARLWRQFWVATDPNPETPENEALDRYFTRIAIANDRFHDEAGEGWRTERGEVFITLGEPDQIMESPPGNDRRFIRWVYSEFRVVLDFEGTMGFSRIRLTPQSRAEFARARAEAMRRPLK